MHTAIHDVETMLKNMPEDSTIDDIQYHLYVLDKVRRGREDIANGHSLSNKEAMDRINQWFMK